jgi:hypothetical protein
MYEFGRCCRFVIQFTSWELGVGSHAHALTGPTVHCVMMMSGVELDEAERMQAELWIRLSSL